MRESARWLSPGRTPTGFSPDQAVAAVREVLDSIGDTCPECTP
ncbi:hypothetical protein BF49_4551 [Bradyrhizobium sp.]|nr:hypothetical protein BF49_4551 [Bradyrhizobium sp.]